MTENEKEMMNSIFAKIAELDYIKPDEIPNIALYMDQVTTFMEDNLASTKRHDDDLSLIHISFPKVMAASMEKIRNPASPMRTATYMDVLSTLSFFLCEAVSFTAFSPISQDLRPDIIPLQKFRFRPGYVLSLIHILNLNTTKLEELLATLKKKEEEKDKNTVLWVLAIIGAVAAVAGIAFAVYRFFAPDYLEDFEEDFDDDFDDYFEDEEE